MKRTAIAKAQLHINGKCVGNVLVHGWEGSWGFGQFQPNDQFTEFAMLFGRWSLLMHAADDEKHLPDAASEELRRAEYEIDALKAKLLLTETKEWRDVAQVNIDGSLIEWKEKYG